jgi:hypothetical protein
MRYRSQNAAVSRRLGTDSSGHMEMNFTSRQTELKAAKGKEGGGASSGESEWSNADEIAGGHAIGRAETIARPLIIPAFAKHIVKAIWGVNAI